MPRHEISFDVSRYGHAQHCLSFVLSIHIHLRVRADQMNLSTIFFSLDAFVCRSASCTLFHNVSSFFLLRRSCTSNTHTLKLSSIACENSISLCLWLFFLLFEYDHYSAYVMYVCARIIIINVDWVLFLFLLQIMSFNHYLSSMVSKMNCRFQLH